MQKILIGINCELEYHCDEYMEIVKSIYGEHDFDYWFNFFYHEQKGNNLRINPKIQQAIIDKNYIIGRFWEEDMKCKIVEIPDDVDWDVGSQECSCDEYVYETYRIWS